MTNANTANQTVHIEIISDVVCPWCIIGFKRLEQALQSLENQLSAEIHWQPFELAPDMPEGGRNLIEHIMRKYNRTREQVLAIRDHMTEVGAAVGFQFNYTDDMRVYNTFKAHQLLHWAGIHNKQTELKLQLFSTFFTEGKAIDQIPVLVTAAEQVGLSAAQAQAVLEQETYADDVKQAAQLWARRGISSVPTYVFNRQHVITGAEEPAFIRDTILQIVQRAA